MPGVFDLTNQAAGKRTSTDNGGSCRPTLQPLGNAPFFPSYATIDEVTNAYKNVLSDVGCNQPLIDDHDVRVIRETIDGTYTYTGRPYGGSPACRTRRTTWAAGRIMAPSRARRIGTPTTTVCPTGGNRSRD